MINNRVKLSTLENNLPVSLKDKEYDPNQIIVIKRDGREEPYTPEKMRKVCLWACDNKETFVDILLNSTRIKLYNKIKISDVYDELIKTAVNSISRIYPQYETIAAKLYLMKIYHDSWKIKDKTSYPKRNWT